MADTGTNDTIRPQKGAATSIAAFVVGLGVIGIVLFGCINVISYETKTSLDLFMQEIAEAESANVKALIEDKFSALHGASAFIVSDNIDDDQTMLDRFREMVDSGAFTRVGVIGSNGNGVGYDFELGPLEADGYSDKDFVRAAIRGEDFVSNAVLDPWGDGSDIVFSVPVYDVKHKGGNPIGALIATTSVSALSEAIDSSLFEGNGRIDIVDSSGSVVCGSNWPEESTTINVLAGQSGSTTELDEMRTDLARGVGGSASFVQQDGTEQFAVYEPIGINDWFINVELPTDYLEAQSRAVLLASVGMAAFVVFVAVLLMGTVFRTKRRSEQALARAALVDDLTGIDNGLAFANKSLLRHEYYNRHHALVLFNLVGFSLYNTIFGYEKGSALLRTVADILSADAKKHELVARLSGDRFVMLIEIADMRAAETRLHALMDQIDEAIGSDETHYQIVSQCCLYRLTEDDAEKDVSLIVEDMAVPLRQKAHAKERIILFDERCVAAAIRARHIEATMSNDVFKEEFLAYFQPQYDIRTGEPVLCGAEALVRWNSPALGLVSPDEFIPIFEKNGFVDRVDHYMLERACIRLRQWMDAGFACVPVSVNLSRQNLFSADLVGRIERIVDSYNIPHDFIELELTEGIVAESTTQLVETANKLRARGFKVAMDDFGTGYSSLSILKDVPFDTIKLDRAFFGTSIDSDRGRTTLMGIIHLLEELGFEIIAEGIESEDEAKQLKSWGCCIIQGFAYGRPVPADEFLKKYLAPAQAQLGRAEAETCGLASDRQKYRTPYSTVP
ncbi:bifunctional diguanylate cyclase/phosphodiesterase [Raoultibacter phocaeensis]|uniref:bifunctional diguanylate cyclase/phosphodiesterase n=1 Tax=Raoultibacter phocaeensis TaxID=2479841 RepID=UPI0015D60019|nr:EAL domain-containing protein [Raoultibacter phocaeensis]